MGSNVSVPDAVASGQQLSPLAEINTEVGKWLVASPAVDHLAADEVLGATGANGRAEGLHLANGVGVLIQSLLSEGAQEEEGTLLVEVLLEDKLVWSLWLSGRLRVHDLLRVWLHWRNRGERWLHTRAAESNLAWTKSLSGHLILLLLHQHGEWVLVRSGCLLRSKSRPKLVCEHTIQISFLEVWIEILNVVSLLGHLMVV